MACGSCSKAKQSKVVVKSSYEPKVGQKVKMTDVLLSFTVEKSPNELGEKSSVHPEKS